MDNGNKILGKKMLQNALKLEGTLADLLRSETRLLKKQIRINNDYESILRINKIAKYLLYSMMIIDDRIKAGLELIEKNSPKDDNKIL